VACPQIEIESKTDLLPHELAIQPSHNLIRTLPHRCNTTAEVQSLATPGYRSHKSSLCGRHGNIIGLCYSPTPEAVSLGPPMLKLRFIKKRVRPLAQEGNRYVAPKEAFAVVLD
jgi:hypothetical protein